MDSSWTVKYRLTSGGMGLMWFERLTGFVEESADQVRANLKLDGSTIKSRVNGREMVCGLLEIPTLADLRARVDLENSEKGVLRLSEVVADVQRLHQSPENEGAVFQVASQFNLLEMTSPSVTPEYGVDRYENDRTQGPACAIACGAGTIYRNYFVEVNDGVGQSAENQIDCLLDLGDALGNAEGRLWVMRNGYALASEEGLRTLSLRLASASEAERNSLREKLRIGIQWNTQVTIGGSPHKVTQVYCSALPVSYSPQNADLWKEFGQFVLEAAYEATLYAAALNWRKSGNNRVFLTLLGGGAFGNRDEWIFRGIDRAIKLFSEVPLDVAIVSYRASNRHVSDFLAGSGPL